jgi:hypothetical protein
MNVAKGTLGRMARSPASAVTVFAPSTVHGGPALGPPPGELGPVAARRPYDTPGRIVKPVPLVMTSEAST